MKLRRHRSEMNPCTLVLLTMQHLRGHAQPTLAGQTRSTAYSLTKMETSLGTIFGEMFGIMRLLALSWLLVPMASALWTAPLVTFLIQMATRLNVAEQQCLVVMASGQSIRARWHWPMKYSAPLKQKSQRQSAFWKPWHRRSVTD